MAFSRWRLRCEEDGSLTKDGEELSVTLKAGRGSQEGAVCKGRGTGGTSALSLERQGCGEKQRPDCQLPPDCTTKISELRVRTGEGGGQKGRGLGEEGDGAGSQGEWLQQPPVPVQTHPGSTRTQRPQSSIHTRIHAHGPRGSETHANARAHTRAHAQGHSDVQQQGPKEHAGPHAAPRPLRRVRILPVAGSERQAESHLPPNGPSPTLLSHQGETPRESCGP